MVCFWVQIFGLALVYMIMNTTGSWLLYIDNPPPLDSLEAQDMVSKVKVVEYE